MFADPLLLNYDVSNETTFNRIAQSGGQSLYADVNNTELIKQNLRILHSTGGRIKGDPNFAVTRHVLTISRDEYVSASLRHEIGVVNLSIAVPNTGTITRSEFDKLTYNVQDFLATSALMDKFYRGEL